MPGVPKVETARQSRPTRAKLMPEATRELASNQSLNHSSSIQLDDLNLLNSITTRISTWQALRRANGHGMFQLDLGTGNCTDPDSHRCFLVELRRLRPCDVQHRLPDNYP